MELVFAGLGIVHVCTGVVLQMLLVFVMLVQIVLFAAATVHTAPAGHVLFALILHVVVLAPME